MNWKIADKILSIHDKSLVMGILNVTPDSFSDGGHFLNPENALNHADRMIAEGADIIDMGGESTRPGAEPITAEEECTRLLPVLKELMKRPVLISIDTRNAYTAEKCLAEGAHIINDISALESPDMVDVCKSSNCGIILMHKQGDPQTMQLSPHYDDIMESLLLYFNERLSSLEQAGIDPARLCIDPGLGFGKTLEHNVTILKNLKKLELFHRPILMGLSRKKFLSLILNDLESGRSPHATAIATLFAHQNGARIHRVHDVKEIKQALILQHALGTQSLI